MPNNIEIIANHIMECAFHRGGSFNRHPIGYGYEELSDKERLLVLRIIEQYGETKDCLPCCWIFDRYELKERGKQLHEEYGNYVGYLAHKEQEKLDEELHRKNKQIAIETSLKTVRLAEEANSISKEANKTSQNANWIAFGAFIVSLISLVVSILLQIL